MEQLGVGQHSKDSCSSAGHHVIKGDEKMEEEDDEEEEQDAEVAPVLKIQSQTAAGGSLFSLQNGCD